MASSYQIPAHNICVEQEIKRSRFIADIGHAESKADAMAFIEQIKKREPDARHHCWAYIAGHPTESIERACSDAGEPQGTAGKPMLNVLQHKHIGEIIVVISRYFGGIKLGAGGLVRAYSSTVQQAIDTLPLSQRILTTTAVVHTPFALESNMRHLLASAGITIKESLYRENVQLHIDVEIGSEAELANNIREKSAGKAELKLNTVK
ncbi:YigZ family protein [Mariprofundus sp. EBB-1]|uniref:YigZ family protein n=1 Tax=Mariprofundus sp. EBB-1 TaxID=2650971 RepID=UPI000EF243C4|nr:YigZ family protein [Mariprofundus sp. EBB-1]RLL53705.1 YigZ family protein [Mariprofundus sp. EBB-1]